MYARCSTRNPEGGTSSVASVRRRSTDTREFGGGSGRVSSCPFRSDLAATDSLPTENQLRDDPKMNQLLETLGYLEKDDARREGDDPTGPRNQPLICTD